MTAKEFKAARDTWLLSQGRMAALLGVSLRTVNGYENGSPIPEVTAKLLRLMIARKIKPESVK